MQSWESNLLHMAMRHLEDPAILPGAGTSRTVWASCHWIKCWDPQDMENTQLVFCFPKSPNTAKVILAWLS